MVQIKSGCEKHQEIVKTKPRRFQKEQDLQELAAGRWWRTTVSESA
jgi:hypothetical protein